MDRPESDWTPYWWASGPDGVWIETWRGKPSPENVVQLARAFDIPAADVLCDELNALARRQEY